MRVEFLEGGMTATAAKMHVEADDAYKEARRQNAKKFSHRGDSSLSQVTRKDGE